jgi:hypothetical protein
MTAYPLRQARWTKWNALFVSLALIQGGLLIYFPSILFVGIGLWWNANTISHNFIHHPFFRSRAMNRLFSCYLSLLLGFPQSLWRRKHLVHHGVPDAQRLKLAPLDLAGVAALWLTLIAFAPTFTFTVYLPGYLLGMVLCALQGHYEHAQGTASHYGRLYNLLFFNDGYHIEHHRQPGRYWRELPDGEKNNGSPFPAILRWLECLNLCALERLVLHSPILQRFVLNRHQRAFQHLLGELPEIHRVGIVGGGLFPRTALILKTLLPAAHLSLIDLDATNLAIARRFIGNEVAYVNQRFDPAEDCDVDLLIIPLAFVGDRQILYNRLPAAAVLVHDWLWRARGKSVVVSWLLLKRLNLVIR